MSPFTIIHASYTTRSGVPNITRKVMLAQAQVRQRTSSSKDNYLYSLLCTLYSEGCFTNVTVIIAELI